MMNLREQIGNRIEEARKKANLTQEDLAKLSGFSRGRLGNYERGTRRPSAEEIYKIATALKVSPSWLLCLNDDTSTYQTPTGTLKLIPIFTLLNLSTSTTFTKFLNHQGNNQWDLLSKHDHLAGTPSAESSPNSKLFAIQLLDDSMKPDVLSQDMLIVDPKLPPQPGKLILAHIKDEKIFVIRKYRKTGKDAFELLTSNADWPTYMGKENEKNIEIIGTVIELRRHLA